MMLSIFLLQRSDYIFPSRHVRENCHHEQAKFPSHDIGLYLNFLSYTYIYVLHDMQIHDTHPYKYLSWYMWFPDYKRTEKMERQHSTLNK